MIGSIRRARPGALGIAGRHAAEQENGLSRSSILRLMAAGILTTGFAAGWGRAFAGTPTAIEPVTDIDKFYDAWQDRFNAWDVEAMLDLYARRYL